MPIPFILGAAGAAGAIVGSTYLSSFYSVNVTPYTEPTTYVNRQQAWRNNAQLLPEPNQFFSGFLKGEYTSFDLRNGLRLSGIDIPQGWTPDLLPENMTPRQATWHRFIRSSIQPAPIDIVWRHAQLGTATNEELQKCIDLHGYAVGGWKRFITDMRVIPTPAELADLRNKTFLTQEQYEVYLTASGITGETERKLVDKLRYQWPTPSDLIPFAVKDVWSQQIVQRFEYDAEFPEIFQAMMDRQGMGWKPSDMGIPVAANLDITWPRAYWRAHWNVISPTQAAAAVHFLRPRTPNVDWPLPPGVQPFEQADFDLVLKTADYPPIMRQWLYGLSFTPLTRVDVRRMFALGVLTKAQVIEAYRDLGYAPNNAQNLADFTEADLQNTRTGRDRARLETIFRNLYLACIYTREEAARAIYAVRIKSEAKRAQYLAKNAADQTAEATGDANINLLLDVLGLQQKLTKAKGKIKVIKRSWQSGVLTQEQTVEALENTGLNHECSVGLVKDWVSEFTVAKKLVTISQLQKWFQRGAIDFNTLVFRLANMGYSDTDAARIAQVAEQDRQKYIAQQQSKLAQTQKQIAQAVADQIRAAEQARKAAIAELNRSLSKDNILKLVKSKLVSPEEAVLALEQRGVLPRDAALLVQASTNGTGQQS